MNFNVSGSIGFNSLDSTAKSALLDFVYPVGSYFYSNSSNFDTVAKVQAHFGGTWTKLGDGYFVEAGSSITTHSAGLPNITGSVFNSWGLVQTRDNSNSGALSWGVSPRTSRYDGNYYSGDAITSINFNANSSNSIYGNSSTVQPKSRTAYIYYRTA